MSRTYHAPRRAEQAAATRRSILDAAHTLFAQHGYAATTMKAIADEARVTAKSVHAVGDKAELLLLVFDQAIVGDDAPVPLADRAEFQAMVDAADARERARLAGRLGADVLLRLYPIYRVLEEGASAEPRLRKAWREHQHRRRTDVEAFVRVIADGGGLADGLTVESATDTVWALLGWYPVALLIEERGWTADQVAQWLSEVFLRLLTPPEHG